MDSLPNVTKIRQHRACQRIADVRSALLSELQGVPLKLPHGATVAIAVGSRGISNIDVIVATLVSHLKSKGYAPFIVPAMGSHGGATAEGQRAVLASYGISESSIGAPIRSSMEVVELPNNGIGNRVFMDRHAQSAGATIVVNRVKVHTDFHGLYESGLLKMIAIGLGKKDQAHEIHSFGVSGLKERILPTARKILQHGNIVMGIGVVENASDETMIIKAIRANAIEDEEKRLIEISRRNMPSLPVDALDILVIDEMGKDISGTGVDTNIIGRMRVAGQPEPDHPAISAIVVDDLTDASHGNAVGVGLVDIVTRRLYEKIDLAATYENVITSTFLERGRIPIVAQNARQAIEIALRACGLGSARPLPSVRMMRIENTLHPEDSYVTPSLLEEVRERQQIEVFDNSCPLLTEQGCFTPWE